MSSQKLRNLRTYHFRNSRALDVARWNYQFEDGSVQDVLKALACYQNADGGFGHGLEPDIRTAESNPMSTWAATRILRECHLPDMSDRMIQKILSYLAASLREDRRWPPRWKLLMRLPMLPGIIMSRALKFGAGTQPSSSLPLSLLVPSDLLTFILWPNKS